MDKKISYCGYECCKCPIYNYTVNNDLDGLKKALRNNDDNATIDSLGCLGCKSKTCVSHMCDKCYIKSCCEEKELENCGKCASFPCDYLVRYISNETMLNLIEIHDLDN